MPGGRKLDAQLHVLLPASLLEALQRLADREGLTVSDIARRQLGRGLKDRTEKRQCPK